MHFQWQWNNADSPAECSHTAYSFADDEAEAEPRILAEAEEPTIPAEAEESTIPAEQVGPHRSIAH